MSSSQAPPVAGNTADSGPAPLPTITRVTAVLVLALAGLGLLSMLSQMRTLTQLRAPILGMSVTPTVAISFSVALGALNVILAILILRRYAWALDGFIFTQAFGLLNNCLYLLSPARKAYMSGVIAQTQARMQATPGLDPRAFRMIMSIAITSGIVLSVVIAVVFITLLAIGRSRYRAVCLAQQA